MSVTSTKQLVLGLISVFALVFSMSSPVLAATDEEAFASAQKGIDYLSKNQAADGSISGFGGETEWSVIGIAAAGQDPATFKQNGSSAIQYLEANPLAETVPATDIERKVLAIAATGDDPASFGGTNYTAQLQSKHVGNQIGDPTLLNDDIFGVIAIDAAKNGALKAMAQDGLDYFLAHQGIDGGFSYTTTACAFCGTDSNDTAAAIIAMYAAENLGLSNPLLTISKDKALVYLLSTQKADGGFGYDVFSPADGSSTAWSLMALNMIGESVRAQASAARDWLIANQNSDGGFSYAAFGLTESSTSITAHAVTALLGSSWLLRPTPLQTATPSIPSPSSQATTNGTVTPPRNNSPQTTTPNSNIPSAQVASVQTETTPTSETVMTPQTKAAQTTSSGKPAKVDKKEDDSQTNFALYGLPVLAVVAGGWYMLQSRNKQEG
jgi:hypothetical protein